MPKSHPPYAPEFRRQMVELVRSGRTPEELSREFEPTAQAIWNWVRQAERDTGGTPRSTACRKLTLLAPGKDSLQTEFGAFRSTQAPEPFASTVSKVHQHRVKGRRLSDL